MAELLHRLAEDGDARRLLEIVGADGRGTERAFEDVSYRVVALARVESGDCAVDGVVFHVIDRRVAFQHVGHSAVYWPNDLGTVQWHCVNCLVHECRESKIERVAATITESLACFILIPLRICEVGKVPVRIAVGRAGRIDPFFIHH